MRKKRADQTPSKTAKLLTVLAVLMAVIMLIFLGRMVSELHRVFARDPYSIIDYDLQQGDYAGMVTEYYHCGFDVAPFSGVREEEYYIAQYADAAFQHQFCQAAGNTEAAGHFAEMMECARQASGSLAAVTGDIDRLLESIPLYP